MPEGGAFLREHADNCKGVPAQPDHLPNRRFVRKQTFLDHLADNQNTAREFNVFVIEIAAIAQSVGISGKKTSIGPDDRQAGTCFHSITNRLPIEVESLEANLARSAFHQRVISQRLAISDVVAVLILLLYVSTRVDVRRIFCELENI